MINFVIAFDNKNSELGTYFEASHEDIKNLLEEQQDSVNSCLGISTVTCNMAYIDIEIAKLNQQPFIFIAYTHGLDNCLKCGGNPFISIDNCHHFSNSLFYSTACLIGRKLAPELIKNGCKTFIGFKEESEVFQSDRYKQIFIECDNYAIKMFLTSNNSIGDSFDSMKRNYTNKIDYLHQIGEDPLFIGSLIANRESLIFLGDKSLKKEDFFI